VLLSEFQGGCRTPGPTAPQSLSWQT
jgi:hypothetical protein